MMAAAATVFVYYSTWALLVVRVSSHTERILLSHLNFYQPFFDASSPIHAWFPPREWAVRLPAFILVVGLSAIGAFIGSTIIRENQKQAQKAKLRAA